MNRRGDALRSRARAAVLSFAAGAGAGAIYAAVGSPDPAPPLSALCGLAGIWAGELVTRRLIARHAVDRSAWGVSRRRR